MAVFLKPQHLTRYRDIARLFYNYGRGDLLAHSGIDAVAPKSPAAAPTNGAAPGAPGDATPADTLNAHSHEELARKGRALADDLERLGPT